MTLKSGTKPKKSGGCLSTLFFVLLLTLGALMLGRNAIATTMVRRAIAQQGIDCGEVVATVPLSLGEVRLAPLSCELPDSAAKRVSFAEGATLELSGLSVAKISAPRVEAALAPSLQDAAQRLSLLGGIVATMDGEAAALPRRMRGYLDALAELCSHDGPRIELGRLVVTGAPGTEIEVDGLAFQVQQGHLSTQMRALELPTGEVGVAGIAHVAVRARLVEPTIRASAAEVSIDATLEIEGLIAGHRMQHGAPFHMAATGLDTDSPRYTIGAQRPRLP